MPEEFRDGATAGWLDATEQVRAGRLRDKADRRRFVRTRVAVRAILSGYVGAPPPVLRWVFGPYGKPGLASGAPAVEFNLSHAGENALLAVAHGRPVGVDVERIRPGLPALAVRFFPGLPAPVPADAARLFARTEACVKASGGSLLRMLGKLPVAGASAVRTVAPARCGPPDGWRVADLHASEGYVAAVALEGPQPFAVNSRRWPEP